MDDQGLQGNIRRVRARYDGLVQGVGFRSVVARMAHYHSVNGYVKNEIDGSVTVVAEGEEGNLKQLVGGIRESQVGSYIRKETLGWTSATGEYSDFEIK